MEIQEGKGPWSRPINRIVPVGSLMTIVIAIADQSSQFDMRVKSCFAHDGVKPPVQLTDEYGCVLRKSMLSEFSKIKGSDFRKNLGDNALALNGYLGKATVISYAHFYAFKVSDASENRITICSPRTEYSTKNIFSHNSLSDLKSFQIRCPFKCSAPSRCVVMVVHPLAIRPAIRHRPHY